MTDETKKQDNEELEFVEEPTEVEDEDLEEVSGGGCGNGDGCVSGYDIPKL